jgi:hypothetical protein
MWMTLQAHLEELNEKHRQLDKEIEELEAAPGSDDLVIHELKREKLRLKDEIARIEGDLQEQ